MDGGARRMVRYQLSECAGVQLVDVQKWKVVSHCTWCERQSVGD